MRSSRQESNKNVSETQLQLQLQHLQNRRQRHSQQHPPLKEDQPLLRSSFTKRPTRLRIPRRKPRELRPRHPRLKHHLKNPCNRHQKQRCHQQQHQRSLQLTGRLSLSLSLNLRPQHLPQQLQHKHPAQARALPPHQQ